MGDRKGVLHIPSGKGGKPKEAVEALEDIEFDTYR